MLVPSLPLLNFDSLGGGVAWNQKYGPLDGIFFRKNRKGKSVPFSRPSGPEVSIYYYFKSGREIVPLSPPKKVAKILRGQGGAKSKEL